MKWVCTKMTEIPIPNQVPSIRRKTIRGVLVVAALKEKFHSRGVRMYSRSDFEETFSWERRVTPNLTMDYGCERWVELIAEARVCNDTFPQVPTVVRDFQMPDILCCVTEFVFVEVPSCWRNTGLTWWVLFVSSESY